MRYLGGKARIARRIATIINAERGAREIWEPFCGGLWMTHALGGAIDASDIHPGLIALYQYVKAGGVLPESVSREEYAEIRKKSDEDPIKAFVGFGCSFGGKWFGGYAAGFNGPLTYPQLARRNVLRHVIGTPGARFTCRSFFDVVPRGGIIGYLDPPYRGSTAYYRAFDSDAFFERVLAWANAGSVMYVSEQTLPIGVEVWARPAKCTLGARGAGASVTERLFRVGPGSR